jgi:hypothetical protein
MQAPWEPGSHFRGRDGFAIEPDYRIEEMFDPEDMSIYFRIWRLKPSPDLATGRKFVDLKRAKECVRMLRKYENRVFHHIED